ncbi:hypothetical protein C8J57DRAFT_1719664 [Mycena rebaudengoi]|nr:hypothetical protein C8J57DRAFT_1719664 [Mycena rebaudengoi]
MWVPQELVDAIIDKVAMLDHIGFDDPSAYPPVCGVDAPQNEARVVLESLTLDMLETGVDALVSSFTTVDINHLQSLVLRMRKQFNELKFLSQLVQKPVDADILERNNTLRAIEVNDFDDHMASTLQLFGHLGHLISLKTISLHLVADLGYDGGWEEGEVDWPKLNAILAQAGDGFADVFISAHSDTGSLLDLAFVMQQLPSVAGKISNINHTYARDYAFTPHLE